MKITAKPPKWQMEGKHGLHDSRYGFYISFHTDEEDEPEPYHASWGEGDSDSFKTLKEAQDWCQEEIDNYIARNALINGKKP
jgi:hypothetical protein